MSNKRHILKAIVYFIASTVISAVAVISGLIVCMLPKKGEPTSLADVWYPVHLPKIAWLWDNDEDGAMGDHRLWYWNEFRPSWPDWLKYYWWLAVRNPANNTKRLILGVDVREHTMTTLKGKDYVRDDFDSTGFQFVLASGGGINKYHFYLIKRYGKSNRALVIELGAKVAVRHNGVEYEDKLDYFKGVTTEINPFKDIS